MITKREFLRTAALTAAAVGLAASRQSTKSGSALSVNRARPFRRCIFSTDCPNEKIRISKSE